MRTAELVRASDRVRSGWWCVRPLANQDALGFQAGDANLYRYVGNDPTNAVDPSGLKFTMLGPDGKEVEGKAAEKLFFDRLSASVPRADLVMKQLQKNKEFQQLWDYLRRSEHEIELIVDPKLTRPGTKNLIWGGFNGGQFKINPSKAESAPLELADTIIHESIHGVLYLKNRGVEPEGVKYPLAADVLDRANDPTMKKAKLFGVGMDKEVIGKNPKLKDYCDKNYGDSASSPAFYTDINFQAQEVIVRITKDIQERALKDAGVKDRAALAELLPLTLTYKNVEKLKKVRAK